MDAIDSAASGMNAAVGLLNVTANNIANANTPGFTAKRANLSPGPTGGVVIDGVQSTGQPVDLANEMTSLTTDRLLYNANAAVLRASEHMSGTLLNILDNQNHDQNQ
jgi:flagellar hook protein FlgE